MGERTEYLKVCRKANKKMSSYFYKYKWLTADFIGEESRQ